MEAPDRIPSVQEIKLASSSSIVGGIWNPTPSTGVTYSEHKIELTRLLARATRKIVRLRNQVDSYYFLAVGFEVAEFIQELMGYYDDTIPGELPTQIGTMNNKWRVILCQEEVLDQKDFVMFRGLASVKGRIL